MAILVYVLFATLSSNYDRKRVIEFTADYASYHDCRQGARNFFYKKMKDPPPYFPETSPAQLDGGIDFEWTCEGHIR